jgi:predicted metalloprotease with PDZ domain
MKTYHIVALLFFPIMFAGNSTAQENKKHEKPMAERVDVSESGWLGVSIQDMTPRLSKRMNLTIEKGALVEDVMDDSPAEKAGLKEDDVIVEFNGKSIDDADDLTHAVRRANPGAAVTIVVMRGNEKKTLQATVGRLPHQRHHFSFMPPLPPVSPRVHVRMFHRPEFGGLSLMELNEQLATYFEAPHGKGVLIEEVEKNSTAEKAGFKAGDVIVKVGKEDVENLCDISDALEEYKKGDKVDVDVIRKGARKTLTTEIDEGSHDFRLRFRSWDRPSGSDFHDFDFDTETFKHDMEQLKQELKSMGKHIREQMLDLKEKIRKDVKEVISS